MKLDQNVTPEAMWHLQPF